MNLHRLRLISFNKSHSPTRTPSKNRSKQIHEKLKSSKCPSKKSAAVINDHLFSNKSAIKCNTTICNRVETETTPLPRKSKSETLTFSFTKVFGSLGHRKTTSLSDIKKRLTKCSKICTDRIRQTLNMFTLKSDPRVNIDNKSGDNIRDNKEIETILSAPSISQRKHSVNIRERNFRSSSNRFGTTQKNVSFFGLYSCLKDINNKKSSGKIRRVRRKKSLVEPDVSSNMHKSASLTIKNNRKRVKSDLSVFHYNLVTFPSKTKRSKHMRIYQSIIDHSKEYKTRQTVDKPVSAASLAMPRHLTDIKVSSSPIINKNERRNPNRQSDVTAHVVHTKSKKPSHFVYSAAIIEKNNQNMYPPFFTRNERKNRKLLKGFVLGIILLVWSPCMITLWVSWCLTYPFRSQAPSYKDEGELYDDHASLKKNKLMHFCCGWTRLISSVLTKLDPLMDLKDTKKYSVPGVLLTRALLKLSSSFTRRSHYNEKSTEQNIIFPQNIQSMHCKVNPCNAVIHSGSRKRVNKSSVLVHRCAKRFSDASHGRLSSVSGHHQCSTSKNSRKKQRVAASCCARRCSKMYVEHGNVPTYVPVQKLGYRQPTCQRCLHKCKTYKCSNSISPDVLNVAVTYPDNMNTPHDCSCSNAGHQNELSQNVSDHLINEIMTDDLTLCPECSYCKTQKEEGDVEDQEYNDDNLSRPLGVIHSHRSREMNTEGLEGPSGSPQSRDAYDLSGTQGFADARGIADMQGTDRRRVFDFRGPPGPPDTRPPPGPLHTHGTPGRLDPQDLPTSPGLHGSSGLQEHLPVDYPDLHGRPGPLNPRNAPDLSVYSGDKMRPRIPPVETGIGRQLPQHIKQKEKINKEMARIKVETVKAPNAVTKKQPPAIDAPKNIKGGKLATAPKKMDKKLEKKKDKKKVKKKVKKSKETSVISKCLNWCKKQIKKINENSEAQARAMWGDEKLDCNRIYVQTLRKRPCFKYFKSCPSCYPHFLMCRQCCFNSWDQCLCCIAAAIYSPILLICYICGVIFCQISNAF